MKNIFRLILILLLLTHNCDAQGWQNCGNGVKGIPPLSSGCYVSAITADTINNILYVAGTFDTINDSVPVHGIATWNGTTWSSIPVLENNWEYFYDSTEFINALIFYHGSLFFPCSYTYDYNGMLFTVYYVGEYNGSSFQLLPYPYLDGPVDCFTVFNDTLYIGGQFYESDTTVLNNIAKWDGTNWKPVGSGFTAFAAPEVLALGVSNGKLYAGGFFDQSGNATHLLSIAQWEDTAWAPLGRGIADPVDSSREGFVNAIGTYQNNLYVGGDFGFAGGDSANNIAEWNGIEWITLGQGAENTVSAFQSYHNKLYAAGAFAIYNVPNTNRIASWDGSKWANIDSGVNAPVYSLTTFQNSLYVGGQFDTAGGIVANCIARWSPDSTSSLKQILIPNIQISVFPNPVSSELTFINDQSNIVEIQIRNILGQSLLNKTVDNGLQKQTIDVSEIPAGIYFYFLRDTNSQMLTGKFVKE